jgi:N-acetylglucosamine-6-phosphate deacetylase
MSFLGAEMVYSHDTQFYQGYTRELPEGNETAESELRQMLTIYGDIVTPAAVLPGGALVIDEQGRIGEIASSRKTVARAGDIDAGGHLVLPGFVDLHVHGGGGADFMYGTPEAARQVARTHARFGTTGLLATTLTASREATDRAIRSVSNVRKTGREADEARLLGIHLEGPYICAARCGAQPAAHVRLPDMAEFAHWVALSGGGVRQITLAPEMDGAEALVKTASEAGIIVSLGHTDATAEQAEAAIGWGARQATHLFNAMTGIHHRRPGVAGTALARPELIAEVVADGVHLHPLIVRLILNAKGPDGAVLITDAMEGAAMPDGGYDLGGTPVRVQDGTATFADGTLAGSVLTMNHAFQNARAFGNLSPIQASRFSSANAAHQLGMDDRLGTLEPGKEADIVILDPITGEVVWTLIQGRVAHRR